MFVETSAALPFGSKMTVVVSLPGLKTPSSIESTVRWSDHAGMGLQFGVMGARETHALVALLSSPKED